MNIQERKSLLERLGQYMLGEDEAWQEAKERAHAANPWFVQDFIGQSVKNISRNFLQPAVLENVVRQYDLPTQNPSPRTVGLVMAGNIPLVGFHDLLCIFLVGHYARVKASSKDDVLVKHLAGKLDEWNGATGQYIMFAELLKGCNAYIATGSDNTGRYFEYYFRKVPSIIRRNRTSVAILTGSETKEELEALADDVYLYFGMGCRNVSQIYVPEGYDFIPLLGAFGKYNYLADHYKFKNNYDYNLAMHILNNKFYMSNESIILVEDPSPFSHIGQLHYQFYTDAEVVMKKLKENTSIQCVVGKGGVPFGGAQCPQMTDFADGVDTIAFLKELR
jgi:hypothetical protein